MHRQSRQTQKLPSLLSVHIHIHGDAGNSKRPAKMSETPDLPARGTELCRNEPERLASQLDVSTTYAGTQTVHKHMQSIESSPGTLVNASASPNLLVRGTKLLVGKPEMDKMDVLDMHTHRETWAAQVYLQTC